MKNALTSLVVTAALIFSACSKKSDTNANLQGGVDGSGGDLQTLPASDVESFLQNNHKYYMRDVIHRLYLIKEKSPKDFGWQTNLAEKFLDIDEEALLKEADNIQYSLASGRCSSVNAGDQGSDAAYTPGHICISYLAFKKMPGESFVQKLIALTLHELGHMRGFSEEEAVRWQETFDRGSLGKKTIFSLDSQYTKFFDILKNIDFRVSIAYSSLIHQKADSKIAACNEMILAEELAMQLAVHPDIPDYISEFAKNKIYFPISEMKANCAKRSEAATLKLTGPLMKDLIALDSMLDYFISPLCKGFVCGFTNLFYSGPNLLSFEEMLSYVEKGQEPNLPSIDKVRCFIKNLGDNEEVHLQFEAVDPKNWKNITNVEQHFPDLKQVYIYLLRDLDEGSVMVKVYHRMNILPLDLHGFAAIGTHMNGGFYTDAKKEISAQFSTYEGGETFLPSIDIYVAAAKAPAVKNTYQLRCSL